MKVIEITQISDAAIELNIVKEHLRLGTGFETDGLEDPVVLAYARAAICAIEARISEVILARDYDVVMEAWPMAQRPLPIRPIDQIVSAQITYSDGTAQDITAQLYLNADGSLGADGGYPTLAQGAQITVRVRAGRGASLAMVNPDLRHAILMLTAHYYDHRADMGLDGRCMPFGVTALLEPYRPIRIGGRSA